MAAGGRYEPGEHVTGDTLSVDQSALLTLCGGELKAELFVEGLQDCLWFADDMMSTA